MPDMDTTLPVIHNLSSGHGFGWFRRGWQAFKRAPGIMIGVLLLWLLISFALQFIPLIGSLGYIVISPALFAGYVHLSRAALHDQPPVLEQFFSGLTESEQRTEMLLLGLFLMVAYMIIFIVCVLFFVFIALLTLGAVPYDTLSQLQSAAPHNAVLTMGVLLVLLLTVLMSLLLFALLTMAFTYASPLVLDGRASAGQALRLSFEACLQNILPLTVFGLFYLVFLLLAIVPLCLGLIVFLPVSLMAIAASYEDIFAADGGG